ncbi:hypothetical protein Tco_0090766 [Tanacetum coccineum]
MMQGKQSFELSIDIKIYAETRKFSLKCSAVSILHRMFKTHKSAISPFIFTIGDFYSEIYLFKVIVFSAEFYDTIVFLTPQLCAREQPLGYVARRFTERGNDITNQQGSHVVENEDLLKQVKELQDGFQNLANRKVTE